MHADSAVVGLRPAHTHDSNFHAYVREHARNKNHELLMVGITKAEYLSRAHTQGRFSPTRLITDGLKYQFNYVLVQIIISGPIRLPPVLECAPSVWFLFGCFWGFDWALIWRPTVASSAFETLPSRHEFSLGGRTPGVATFQSGATSSFNSLFLYSIKTQFGSYCTCWDFSF